MLIYQFFESVRDNPELFALLTFFIGLGAGHWLSLGRDKRKEFNAAALPIRTWLLREASRPSPYTHVPTGIEIDTFAQSLSFRGARKFAAAYKNQEKVRHDQEENDSHGAVFYKDPAPIIKAIHRCLPYTNRK